MVCAADSVVAPAAVGKVVVAAAETETAPRTTETRRAVSCIFANSGFGRGTKEAGIKGRERIENAEKMARKAGR